MLRSHLFVFAVLLGNIIAIQRVRADENPPEYEAVISVADQKIVVLRDGGVVAKYPVSTSRFGVGDGYGTYKTPLGRLKVCEKLGDRLPEGAVIKHRRATGEVLPANARGRDPIVTRILWLEGLEAQNSHARDRSIYIHGTPEEKLIGRPASYGCIRMKSDDVVALYDVLGVGATISIVSEKLPRIAKYQPRPEPVIAKVEPPVVKPEPKLVAAAKVEPPAVKAEPKLVAAARVEAKAPAPLPRSEAKAEEKSSPSKPETKPETRIASVTPPAVKANPARNFEADAPKSNAAASSRTAPRPVLVAARPAKTEPEEASTDRARPSPRAAGSAAIAATSPAAPKKTAGSPTTSQDTRLASVSIDQSRLVFLRNHEAALTATPSGSDLVLRNSGTSSTDFSARMKGSILEAGLPQP